MKNNIYRERFWDRSFPFIVMACPFSLTTLVRTFRVREQNIVDNILLIFYVVIISIIGILLATFLLTKSLLLFDEYFIVRTLFCKKKYYYHEIEECFYDDTQYSICMVIGDNVKKISLEHYNEKKDILLELKKKMIIEEL